MLLPVALQTEGLHLDFNALQRAPVIGCYISTYMICEMLRLVASTIATFQWNQHWLHNCMCMICVYMIYVYVMLASQETPEQKAERVKKEEATLDGQVQIGR